MCLLVGVMSGYQKCYRHLHFYCRLLFRRMWLISNREDLSHFDVVSKWLMVPRDELVSFPLSFGVFGPRRQLGLNGRGGIISQIVKAGREPRSD